VESRERHQSTCECKRKVIENEQESEILLTYTEKVLVVCIEDQTSHNIPKPNPEQSPNFLKIFLLSMREVRKVQKKSLKLAEFGS
jgi:hypothetical protein